jgi:hypothetical protein
MAPSNGMYTRQEMDKKSWPNEKPVSLTRIAAATLLSLLTGGLYPRQAE